VIMSNKKKAEEETREPTFEELLKELPLKDEHKQLLVKVVSGIAGNLQALTERLDKVETQPAADNPDLYAGLSAEQKYNVLLAKASAPAAAAQQNMIQTLLSRAGGGSGGGELAGLFKSAESIAALRNILSPAPSPLQAAMEKAQVSQMLAQTRLMNKVAGKATDDYLEKIAAEVAAAGEEKVEEAEKVEEKEE